MIQVIAKLKSHERLNALSAELGEMESLYRSEMLLQYERQALLCHRLHLPEPEPPAFLLLPDEPVPDDPPPLWRRLLRRRKRTVADGSPHSRASIIGRQGAGFALGAVWKAWSSAIMNLLRPVTSWALSLLPRAAPAVGTGSSIVASTGLRFALGVVAVVGIVVGPLLMAFAIGREVRKVQKARRELTAIRAQHEAELVTYAARTRHLQRLARMRAYAGCSARTRMRCASAYILRKRRSLNGAVRPEQAAAPSP